MISRGKYWYKYHWYSICSIHRDYNKECRMCNAGHWVNVWRNYIDNIIYKISPKLWRKGFNISTTVKSKNFDHVSKYLQKKERLDKLKKLSK